MDGEINYAVNLDAKQAEAELNRLNRNITKMESDLAVKNAKRSAIEEQLNAAKAAAEETRAKIQELQEQMSNSAVWKSTNTLEQNQAIVAERQAMSASIMEQNELLREQEATVASLEKQYNSVDASIKDTESTLDVNKEQAGELAAGMYDAADGAGELNGELRPTPGILDEIIRRIKGLAKRVFFFSLITRAFRGILKYVTSSLAVNEQYAASMKQLRAALLSVAYPILQVVTPAIIGLVRALTTLFATLANVVSILFGSTLSATTKSAKALEKEKAALAGTGKAAGKAGKELASFDEINKIGDDGSGGGGGGYDFDGLANMREEIAGFQVFLTGMLLALGAILLFTGHPFIGAACIALGVLSLVSNVKEQWGGVNEELTKQLTVLLTIISPFFFVLGVVMLFANPMVGIALMLLGAAGLVEAVALQWDSLDADLQETLTNLMKICSGALIAIGMVLMATGNIPLGLAVLIAGVALVYQAAALNWDYLRNNTDQVLQGLLQVVSVMIAVLGVILLFLGNPILIPIGLGMIIAGVAIFACSTQMTKWDEIPAKTKSTITNILTYVGLFLAVLGIILLFVGLPLIGLGMIVAGVGIFGVGQVLAQWDFIPKKIEEAWEMVKQYYNEHIKKYLSWDYWYEKAKGIVEAIKSGLGSIGDAFKGLGQAIGDTLFSAPSITGNTSMSRAAIPQLASGAVIPANQRFLAVLGDQKSGTNIEAPLATIEQAVANVMGRMGGGGGNQTIIMQVDGQQFAKLVYNAANNESRRVGVNLMEG